MSPAKGNAVRARRTLESTSPESLFYKRLFIFSAERTRFFIALIVRVQAVRSCWRDPSCRARFESEVLTAPSTRRGVLVRNRIARIEAPPALFSFRRRSRGSGIFPSLVALLSSRNGVEASQYFRPNHTCARVRGGVTSRTL